MTRLAVPLNVTAKIDLTNNPVFYFGEAPIGASTSLAIWKISRLTISGNIVTTEWADSNCEFDNVWDDRTTLTYG